MYVQSKKLIVIGSPVVDRIIFENREYTKFGGISYSLWALGKFYEDIEIIPLMNIGDELYESYLSWLHNFRNINTRYISRKGGVNYNTLVYNGLEREEYMRINQEPVEKIPEELLKSASGVYINFITRHDVDINEIVKIKEFQIPVYMDLHSFLRDIENDKFVLKHRQDWRLPVSCANYLQMNIEEFKFISKGRDFPEFLKELEDLGPGTIIITKGEEGLFFYNNSSLEELKPEEVCDKDPTGCGDILGAVFTGEFLRGEKPEVCVRKAIKIATLKACGYIKFP